MINGKFKLCLTGKFYSLISVRFHWTENAPKNDGDYRVRISKYGEYIVNNK